MELKKDDLMKMFFTVQDQEGKHSAFIQISGFETEDEAKMYLAKIVKNANETIYTEMPTIH